MPPTEGSKVVFSIETDEDILRDYSGVLEEHYPELDWTPLKFDVEQPIINMKDN